MLEWIRAHIFRQRRWVAFYAEDETIQVIPLYDRITHDENDDCICGPHTDAVPREDGTYGWLVTHHSLDGRETRNHAHT